MDKAEEIFRDNHIGYKQVSSSGEVILVCPSCGKDDHFYFNVKKNLGICHRCKWQCDLTILLMALLDLSRDDALELSHGHRDTSPSGLRGKVGLLLDELREVPEDVSSGGVFFINSLPAKTIEIDETMLENTLVERGSSFKELRAVRARLCVDRESKYNNRIIFPIETIKSRTFTAVTCFPKGKVKMLQKRAKEKGRKYRKSLFPKGSFISEVLYGYNTNKKYKRLFVVEGIWDWFAIKRHSRGVVGLLGSDISDRQASLLSKTKAEVIYLMLDGSIPLSLLKKLHDKVANACYDKEVRACVLADGKDPDEATFGEIRKSVVNSRVYLF